MEVLESTTGSQGSKGSDIEMIAVNQETDNISETGEVSKDDLIFAKPQLTSIKGKLKKSIDTSNNVQHSQLSDQNNIYVNPQSSSSNGAVESPEVPKTNVGNLKIHGDKDQEGISEPLHPQPSTSKTDLNYLDEVCFKKYDELYAPDDGPQMYHAKGNLVTRPIITKNLPKVFQYLPIYGKPEHNVPLKEFYRTKVREYVGCDLNDEDFSNLENYCNPELLTNGQELKMQPNVLVMGVLRTNLLHNHFIKPDTAVTPPNLVTLKKNRIRIEQDVKGLFPVKLKYRGMKMIPFTHEEKTDDTESNPDEELNPGLDILYKVRVYRPYTYNTLNKRYTRTRHSVFSSDILITGRHKLSDLRDRFVCHNDFDIRVDVSDHPEMMHTANAKELFPSGFLFINNVFYVDTREGCIDYSEPIREWANKRNIGDFPKKDMCQVRLQDLVLKLGYPEVYVHQGNCEHVFLFSEVRLISPSDPLRMSKYPCSTAIAQNQTVYCTTCAEFSAKWIVVGSERIPFDPGFLCDTCFKLYMYKDGHKIGQFKAYRYRGNALNVLKP